jgi:hypothetical protein
MLVSSLSILLLGCGSGGLSVEPSNIASLRVEPDALQLVTGDGEPATASFSAIATLKDGVEVPLDLVAWSSSNLSAGNIDPEGAFQAVETNGGVTTIDANHLGIVGQATVTVVYARDVFEDGLDEAVAEAFAAATAEEDSALQITYPPDQVTVPRNLLGLIFRWADDGAADVYRIRFQSDITDVSVYLTQASWEASQSLWEIISASNKRGVVNVSIEAGTWDGETLSSLRAGPGLQMAVNRLDARGSVLYWETSAEAIMRIPFGSTDAEVFWGAEDSNGFCSGCHTLIENPDSDEDIMVVTHDGVNGRFSVVDVADPEDPFLVTGPDDDNRLTFQAASPDSRYLIGTKGPEMTLYEASTGEPIKRFSFDAPVTHPAWSPDGGALMLVQIVESIDGRSFGARSDMDFERGEIVEYAWDTDTLELGEATILKAADIDYNYYYPAYSPDGAWIAYNRSAIGAYASPDAEVWLMSRDGSHDIRLDNANGEGDLQNSFPRWGPLPDDEILWLAFSSRRVYTREGGPSLPQIWVAAIDPALAEEGKDPSAAPFWLPGQNLQSDNHLPLWWSK